MDTRSISISDYNYLLPEERIASFPLANRDASRLLIYHHQSIREDVFRNIDEYLSPDHLIVFNNTRVIEARLLFQKPSGGTIEIFCLEPGSQHHDISSGMLQQGHVQWKCLVGGASKWKKGQVLEKKIIYNGQDIILEARYKEKQPDFFIIDLQWLPANLSFAEILHAAGVVPLPPYIKRTVEVIDAYRYQTVYALQDGSVAAPTAGLHFTPAIFEKLQAKNITKAFVTLHVGAGTFKPVKSATMQDHDMHAEFMEVTAEFIEQLILFTGKVFAVGTTSARTLESLYWMGVKIYLDAAVTPEQLFLNQWEVYDRLRQEGISTAVSLQTLLEWMKRNNLQRLVTKTQLLITPGYTFKTIRGLVTNFHQPQSTLLLLVAALAGNDWKNIYAYALDHGFRFLSYGDACLIMSDV